MVFLGPGFFIWMAGKMQGIYSVPHLKRRP